MSALGQFLEISVPAADLGASLEFWLRLGFTELRVNDIRSRGYAAVTDGQIVVGLHALGLDEPALTFVKPDLAQHARALVDAGTELAFQRLDNDQFNEVGLRTPDGQLLLLLEAPTFSVSDDEQAAPVIGRCTEVTLASALPDETRTFFELAGFLGSASDDEDAVLLAAPGVTLRFEPGGAFRPLLEARGIAGRPSGADLLVLSPEGTRLLLSRPCVM